MNALSQLSAEARTDEAEILDAATRAARVLLEGETDPGAFAAVMFRDLGHEGRAHAIRTATGSDYFKTLIAQRAGDMIQGLR